MSTCCLRESTVRLHLQSVHQIRELDRILDEEDWDVVAHQIPVAFVSVELKRKASDSRGVSTDPAPPATVDIRAKIGVFLPFWNTAALVRCEMSLVASK